MSMENFNFSHKFLSTFDGVGDDADTIGVAREEATAIINVFGCSQSHLFVMYFFLPVYNSVICFLEK
jgi:hypothetical protein